MGAIDKNDVFNYFEEFFKNSEYNQDPGFNSLALLNFTDLLEGFDEIVDYLNDLDLLDESVASYEDMFRSRSGSLTRLLPKSPIAEMKDWYWFNERKADNYKPMNIIKPVVKQEKVGRNAPCPCGSGKKFKKCCG